MLGRHGAGVAAIADAVAQLMEGERAGGDKRGASQHIGTSAHPG